MRISPCPVCHGQRLKAHLLAVTVGGINIYQMTSMSIVSLKEFMEHMELTSMQHAIGDQILRRSRPGSDSWWTWGWSI